MIYNLLVIHSESGNNVATIKVAENGFDENEGILMSGVIKAIEDFLNELKIGNIRSFNTHERQVIIYKQKYIFLVLICDEDDDPNMYLTKIEYIANLFNEGVDWTNWYGETTMFDEIKKRHINY
ncbi:MAG: hypothetical protein ACTSQS_17575 [Promethearchaeota archaeon]